MVIFRTLRSGSSGNALLLEWGEDGVRSRLLIDCGLSSQKGFQRLLEEEVGLELPLSGVLLTHAHSDHANYAAMRVIDRLGIPVYAHEKTREQLHARQLHPGRVPASVSFSGLEFREFGDACFTIEGLEIDPIPVSHAPGVHTHAFRFDFGHHRLVVATDFHEGDSLIPFLDDVDLVYIESNHDPELLRLRYNPASTYHMSNEGAAELMDRALELYDRPPRTVVLGHLSTERNSPALALAAMKPVFEQNGHAVQLIVAPRHTPSERILVKRR